MSDHAPQHGGPDALGVPLHDFSTNANACGPCPQAIAALRQSDFTHYPDPAYTALRAQIATFHGVAVQRVVLAASASEFIHRITAHAARSGVRQVVVPAHGYGDYTCAAQVWELDCRHTPSSEPALHWACEPASPLGTTDAALTAWCAPAPVGVLRILDCAYAPLRLEGAATVAPDAAWQMWTPNKALGLTGVRAAYAIAPSAAVADGNVAAVQALAASWPVGTDGVALLAAWVRPDTQAWLAQSLATLREWKAAQLALCAALGWAVAPGSLANFFTACPPVQDVGTFLQWLRARGVKLRDCTSFGLPGHVRLGVLPPQSQRALEVSWRLYKESQ
ncbi:aminotransferase class I/II-fold pyridoxal phosphate-dependent enzyme [Diaphorobacter sp. LR2014-1]|uniref:aminotransferase class I/II-fold pyridoxal phosphate-dependent enzyme n=1 Tax=Diaphorobacter sp. LR2014-1 TaxID=1933219 RepID=UPI000CDA7294|nr:aminotransferase class I/II-fold pyridoxal phosphate-dependent enzyme [Diaphorobacter sp. LR2014-1]POR11796.1 aminotransferase [Diaphorobacter sp. LR2014-1]